MTDKPDMRRAWANNGSRVNPGNAKIDEGWTAEKPPFQTENWLQNRTDEWFQHMEERGTPEWDANIIYLKGGRVYYQEEVWQSLIDANLGNAPVAGEGNWIPIGELHTPPGTIVAWAGSASPSGWLLCAGTAISRTANARLFSFIGTTYGAGDGATTFNIPNLIDRVPIGAGTLAEQGEKIGSDQVQLTAGQSGLPNHSHKMFVNYNSNIALSGNDNAAVASSYGNSNNAHIGGVDSQDIVFGSTSNASGNAAQPHNNVQPSLGVNWIIKT